MCAATKACDNPTLLEWAIIRVSLSSNPGVALFLFTGIGYGHPRLPDFVQFVKTEIQEISPDETWGRSRSRIYNLVQPLSRDEFSPELADEVRELIEQRIGRAVDVEWISIEDWRRLARTVGNDVRQS